MQRRYFAPPAFLPGTLPAQTSHPIIQSPYAMAPFVPSYYLPSQNYYDMCVRYPYGTYPQYSYPGYPLSGLDQYRYLAPPAVGMPYQFPPPGYQLIRPSWIPPTRIPSVPVDVTRQPHTVGATQLGGTLEGMSATAFPSALHNTADGAQTSHPGQKHKSQNKKARKLRAVQRKSGEQSSYRPRYGTNFRLNSSRRRALKLKKRFASQNSSSCVTELSSIAKIIPPEDEEYETCSEEEHCAYPARDETSNWFNDTALVEKAPVPISEGGLPEQTEKECKEKSTEYTFITNDKSYSYVNFDPTKLPKTLGRMWLESGAGLNEAQLSLQKAVLSKEKDEKEREVVHSKSTESSDLVTSSSRNAFPVVHVEDKRNNKVDAPRDSLDTSREREMWWDNSTDIGCRAPGIINDKSKGDQNSNQSNSSQTVMEAIITEVKDFVVVDSAFKQVLPTIIDDVNNNFQKVLNDSVGKDNAPSTQSKSNAHSSSMYQIPEDSLNLRWGLEGKSVTPVLPLKGLSRLPKGKVQSEAHCDVLPVAAKEGAVLFPHITDDDRAIVTVIHHNLSINSPESTSLSTESENCITTTRSIEKVASPLSLSKKTQCSLIPNQPIVSSLSETVNIKGVDSLKELPSSCVPAARFSLQRDNVKMCVAAANEDLLIHSTPAVVPESFSTPATSEAEKIETEFCQVKTTPSAHLPTYLSSISSKTMKTTTLLPSYGANIFPSSRTPIHQDDENVEQRDYSWKVYGTDPITPSSLHIDCRRFNDVSESRVPTPHAKTFRVSSFLGTTFSLQNNNKEKTYIVSPICYDQAILIPKTLSTEPDTIVSECSPCASSSQKTDNFILKECTVVSSRVTAKSAKKNKYIPSSAMNRAKSKRIETLKRNKFSELSKSKASKPNTKSGMCNESPSSSLSFSSGSSSKAVSPIMTQKAFNNASLKPNRQATRRNIKTKRRRFVANKRKSSSTQTKKKSPLKDKFLMKSYGSRKMKSVANWEDSSANGKLIFKLDEDVSSGYCKMDLMNKPNDVIEDIVIPIKEAAAVSKYVEITTKTSLSKLSGSVLSPLRLPGRSLSSMSLMKLPLDQLVASSDKSGECLSRKIKSCSHLENLDESEKKVKKSENDYEKFHKTEDVTEKYRCSNENFFPEKDKGDWPPCDCILSTSSHLTKEKKNSVMMITHGRVKSSIKSIVHNLVSKSTYGKENAPASPSLAALQSRSKVRLNKIFPAKNVGSPVVLLSKLKIRSNSEPSSPVNISDLERSQRSASLSDVFYDSTMSSSTFLASSSAIKKKSKLHALSSSKKKSKLKSTYVSFSPPTMTPPNQDIVKNDTVNEQPKPKFPHKVPLLPLISTKEEDSPKDAAKNHSEGKLHIDNSNVSGDWDKEAPMKRVLEEKVEEEIRKTAETLLKSISEVSHLTPTPEKPFYGIKENLNEVSKKDSKIIAVTTLPASDEQHFSSNSLEVKNNKNVSNENSNSCGGRGRRKSFDKCTQTADELIPLNDQTKEAMEGHHFSSKTKLNIPPKKPPRSNSPSASKSMANESSSLSNSTNVDLKTCGNAIKSITSVNSSSTASSSSNNLRPIISVMPINTESRLDENTFIPLPWNLLPISDCCNNHSYSQNLRVDDNSIADGPNSQQAAYFTNASFGLPAANFQRTPNSVIRFNTRVGLDPKVQGRVAAPFYVIPPPYPLHPHPNRAPEIMRLMPRRRRSFSGISSSAVAKARLNRRFFNPVGKRSVKFWKFPHGSGLNLSHPPTCRRVRRPRFVRSSLTDDTVYESVKENCQVFVTKPVRRVPLSCEVTKRKQDERVSKENEIKIGEQQTAKESSNQNTAVTNTGSCNEAVITESKALIAEKKLSNGGCSEEDLIVDDNSVIEMEKEDDKNHQTCSKPSSSKPPEMKDPKKSQKYSTLQKIKRYVSGTIKPAKQEGDSEVVSKLHDRRKCKTDSKVLRNEQPQTYTSRDHIRDMFRKSKKIITEKDDESTLKAENVNSDCHAFNGTGASSTLKKPGLRESFDIKSALFKPSFLVIATAEINTQRNNKEESDASSNHGSTEDLADCTAATIHRHSDQHSVTTPGVRINSETGDVIDEAKQEAEKEQKSLKKILSSTAVDEKSRMETCSTLSTDTNFSLQLTDSYELSMTDTTS